MDYQTDLPNEKEDFKGFIDGDVNIMKFDYYEVDNNWLFLYFQGYRVHTEGISGIISNYMNTKLAVEVNLYGKLENTDRGVFLYEMEKVLIDGKLKEVYVLKKILNLLKILEWWFDTDDCEYDDWRRER